MSSAKGKKKMKQGTLFSFFSKKPGQGCNVAAKKKVDTNQQTSPLWQQVSIGAKVSVYWEDDDAYYDGTITSAAKNKSSMFTVTYDDGDVETLDLARQQFKILQQGNNNNKQQQQSESDESTNKQNNKRPRPRATTTTSSKRAKHEAAEQKQDHKRDDESEYEFQGSDKDDEEESAQWMVTDDEDGNNNSSGRKKRKKLSGSKASAPPKVKVTHLKATAPPQHTRRPIVASTPPPPNNPGRGKPVSPSDSCKRNLPGASRHGNDDKKKEGGTPLAYVKDAVNPAGSHAHNHLKFLRHPRDARRRSPHEPGYDATTLYVDYNELRTHQKDTGAVLQWWELKAQYFDTILLFKTGKFYELYHMDADVGVSVLSLSYMKGHIAHAGFPEIGYGKFTQQLVAAGYKVARIEQTETPEMLKRRKAQTPRGKKKPNVMNREVCSIVSPGTRTHCHLDAPAKSSGPLLAIQETLLQHEDNNNNHDDDDVKPVCEYGITIVDAARAVVTIGQFADNVLRVRLKTLLTTVLPSEILVEENASETLLSLIRSTTVMQSAVVQKVPNVVSFPKATAIDPEVRRKLERPSPTAQPWNVDETLSEIHRRGYYPRGSKTAESKSTNRWPEVLHMAITGGAEKALSSFGAVLYVLQRNLIDYEILSMGQVEAYVPPEASDEIKTQQENESQPTTPFFASGYDSVNNEEAISHMALDGTTLQNLEILSNSSTLKTEGSLWSKINRTKTPHGSRLLRAWLLRPMFRKADIQRRSDAVEELVSGAAAVALSEARGVLASCGDIERLLSRIHTLSCGATGEEAAHHPNERAILYETAIYNKRKMGDFSKALNGLRNISRIPEIFEGIDIQSGLIKNIVCFVGKGGCFPDMTEHLDWFFDNFDCEKAARGDFEAARGLDQEFDDACDAIDRIKRELEDYREEMCSSELGGAARQRWKYINTKDDSKDKYLIELPASMPVPEDFIVKGKRGKGAKQVNKYQTPVVTELTTELEAALEVQKHRKAKQIQLIFHQFDTKRQIWAAASQASAVLDALGALAEVSSQPGHVRATILDCPPSSQPSINVVQGRHPCVDITHNGGEFIPNDLALGGEENNSASPRVLLLSGPNMGGKSTLLRQTCLISVMAQMGCFVPAESCSLTPVDRIFTRLGASDRILLGQSTFFVELAEMACALRGASRRSLVIMDELGRGTSTFDGTAIASACVGHLVHNNQCLALFATHYHSLLQEWAPEPSVRLGHMECHVENGVDDQDNENSDEHNITFLYTLGEGACPKSFGINVAKLAGLPHEVLSKAKQRSTSFERQLQCNKSTNSQQQRQDIVEAIENEDLEKALALWENTT